MARVQKEKKQRFLTKVFQVKQNHLLQGNNLILENRWEKYKEKNNKGLQAKWEDSTKILTVYVRDNGKYNNDTTLVKLHDSGMIGEAGDSGDQQLRK